MSEFANKSSVEEIRQRFDQDVERFSKLETGQTSTMDAVECLELVARASQACVPNAKKLLDIGCGAGNFSLKLLQAIPGMDVVLMDLSQPMLQRAEQRLGESSAGIIQTLPGDLRELTLPSEAFDIVIAAAVLHHLRDEDEWVSEFQKIYESLAPGGCFWIFDLVEASSPAIESLMKTLYGEYLSSLKDEAYRDHVFAYIAKEDTPRPLMFQLNLLQQTGFVDIEVLHKRVSFAAFGGRKPQKPAT